MRVEQIANVNSMRAISKHCKFKFHESWVLSMWILWELIFENSNKWELSFGNLDFMRAEHSECEFYENWSLHKWSIWELSFVNAKLIITAEHYECEFIRTEHCECEFMTAEHWKCEFLWELSFANINVNLMRAEHCRCEFYEGWALGIWICESWALWIWILWGLSFLNINFMRADH